mmetsp:Transcript_5106/g.14997  ORF Transcript_5106/g.14997 Transcript_5106/m.14997 type:complete len:280 (-) Transcript_5106:70-909(-)
MAASTSGLWRIRLRLGPPPAFPGHLLALWMRPGGALRCGSGIARGPSRRRRRQRRQRRLLELLAHEAPRALHADLHCLLRPTDSQHGMIAGRGAHKADALDAGKALQLLHFCATGSKELPNLVWLHRRDGARRPVCPVPILHAAPMLTPENAWHLSQLSRLPACPGVAHFTLKKIVQLLVAAEIAQKVAGPAMLKCQPLHPLETGPQRTTWLDGVGDAKHLPGGKLVLGRLLFRLHSIAALQLLARSRGRGRRRRHLLRARRGLLLRDAGALLRGLRRL